MNPTTLRAAAAALLARAELEERNAATHGKPAGFTYGPFPGSWPVVGVETHCTPPAAGAAEFRVVVVFQPR